MKLRAVLDMGRLFQRLRAHERTAREAAVDAAAEALKSELTQMGANGISVQPQNLRRTVGSQDPAEAAREFGTLTETPSPWLAPALPTALEPMRTAARIAAVRAISALGERKK